MNLAHVDSPGDKFVLCHLFYLLPFQDIFDAGWDETNFLEQDREIRLIKTHYETKTEKELTLIFCTRRDREETVSFLNVRDETKTIPRVSVFFLRDQDKSQLLTKKIIEYWYN